MSDTRDPDTDQVLPIVNDRPFIQDLVIADIEERKQKGIRKYGTALQSGNGRNMLLDAYEEVLDLAIYLRGMLDEQSSLAEAWDKGHITPKMTVDEKGLRRTPNPYEDLTCSHCGAVGHTIKAHF